MSQFSNIDPAALDTVTGALATSRSSTSDQLLTTLNSLSTSISDIKNQNNNNGFSNPTTMLLFAMLASQRQNNSSTTVVYRRGWW